MSFESFVYEYFTKPLANPAEAAPYNLVNTAVFALLAVLAAWLIFKALRKLGIKIDWEFTQSVLPFILLGAVVRALVDAQILPRSVQLFDVTIYPFVTPLIYVLVFVFFALCFVTSLLASRRGASFHFLMRSFGWVAFAIAFLLFLPLLKRFDLIAVTLILTALGFAVLFAVAKATRVKHSPIALFAAGGQFFDGAATFTGIFLAGYGEQHVVGNAIISVHPFLFYLAKIAFAIIAVELLSREKPSEEMSFVLLLVGLLGLAPGVRDVLRVSAGV